MNTLHAYINVDKCIYSKRLTKYSWDLHKVKPTKENTHNRKQCNVLISVGNPV